MKIIRQSTMLLLLAVMLSGCDKFLSQSPKDFLSPELSYDSKESLDKALNGVYDILGHRNLYGGYFLYNCGFDADDGHYSRNSPAVGAHVYNFSSTDITVYSVWESLYKGVSRANTLLKNIDRNQEIDIDFRNRVRGEALCLRAYYYFLLVTLYRDVPLILEPVTDARKILVARTKSSKIYEQILTDLTEAEPLVTDITEIGHGGRISKSAVRGVAARVCLHMAGYPLLDKSKYAEARDWALKVINDKVAGHELAANYADVFIRYAKDEYDPKESIWEVEFFGTDSSEYDETTMNGRYTGPTSNSAKIGKCLGMVYATGTLWDKYPANDAEDMRKAWNIACFSYNLDGSKKMLTGKSYPSLFYRFAGKFRREYWPHPESSNTSINFPLLRYADVLLMFAEAENAINGPTEAAVSAVNTVRRRALCSGIKSVTITSPGSGYTSAPSIKFVGNASKEAIAVAKVRNGKLEAVSFVQDAEFGLSSGAGYSELPQVVITGGGGSGAAAECVMWARTDADLTAEEYADAEAFLKVIQDERSRELCFEGLRRGDLIRWGIFTERMNDVYNLVLQKAPNYYYLNTFRNATNEKHLLWPIPAREIAANSMLTQNKNW